MSISSEKVKRWREATKIRIVKAMGEKCCTCGYNKSNSALDLHHLDPEQKEFRLGAVMANPKSWPKIVVELRKCVMLCSNCHREVHAGERYIPENSPRFDESFAMYPRGKGQCC